METRITKKSSNLTILEAWYGQGTNQVDVKSIVQNRIMDGAVFVRASNQYFGVDPIIGVRKIFFVRYRIQEGVFEASSEEEQNMVIPDLGHKKNRWANNKNCESGT